jgi:uncharacterized membrane protein (GlpM family)
MPRRIRTRSEVLMTHAEMMALAACIFFARAMPKWLAVTIAVICWLVSSYLSAYGK